MSIRTRSAVGIALLVGLTGLSQTAQAELTEIVVTARKVEEKLIDVPLAITALSAQTIENRGIRNLDDVAANTPGLTFSNLQGEFLPSPVIRGMAPINVLGGENNVGIYIDGIFVSGREGLNFNQLDLERIEVIKGPQASLYGRNSFSGAINYVTARPTDEFVGKTEITYGTDGRELAALSASGPLIEGSLRGRISVSMDDFDGSYDNSFVGFGAGAGSGSGLGGYEYRTAQGTLNWSPTENFDANLMVYLSDDTIDNSAMLPVAANCENRRDANPALSSRLLNFCGTFRSVSDSSMSALPEATGENRHLSRYQLEMNWAQSYGTFTSLTGYSDLRHDYLVDGTRNTGLTTPFTFITTPTTSVFLGPPPAYQAGALGQLQTGLLQIGPTSSVSEISQELRFTSPETEAFRYSAGVYLFHTNAAAPNDGVAATAPLPANFYSFCLACANIGPSGYVDFAAGAGDAAFLPWFTNPTGDSIPGHINRDQQTSSAVFGSTEYDFDEQWTGRLEGRYTHVEKKYSNTLTDASDEDTWNTVDWRATVDYKIQENWMLYGAVAHAEKSGNFDPKTVQLVSNPGVDVSAGGSYDPEKNDTYELGAKADLLDKRLQAEFSVYYIDWTDIVIPQIVEEVDGEAILIPTAFQTNGGDATIKGAELSLTAAFTDYLTGGFGIAYLDAEYGDAEIDTFSQFPSYAATNGNVDGNTILRTSEWQSNASLGYQAPVPGRDVEWYLRGDVSYRGKQYADATNQATIPSSTIANAHLGLTTDTWTLELWSTNLFDNGDPVAAYRDVYFTNTLPDGTYTGGGSFFPYRYSVSYPRLREFGVTWRMRF